MNKPFFSIAELKEIAHQSNHDQMVTALAAQMVGIMERLDKLENNYVPDPQSLLTVED